jgi:hypothetical protein
MRQPRACSALQSVGGGFCGGSQGATWIHVARHAALRAATPILDRSVGELPTWTLKLASSCAWAARRRIRAGVARNKTTVATVHENRGKHQDPRTQLDGRQNRPPFSPSAYPTSGAAQAQRPLPQLLGSKRPSEAHLHRIASAAQQGPVAETKWTRRAGLPALVLEPSSGPTYWGPAKSRALRRLPSRPLAIGPLAPGMTRSSRPGGPGGQNQDRRVANGSRCSARPRPGPRQGVEMDPAVESGFLSCA